VIIVQTLLLARIVVAGVRWNLAMSQQILRPARLMTGLFMAAIVIGGCLLSLPAAQSPALRAESGHYATQGVLNCFFTATSATCVTGLSVLDTGRDFTRFGQIVILALLQLGGLGIMIFSSIFGLLVGQRLSLRYSLALQDTFSHRTVGQISSLVRFILITTFALELAGACVLYPLFYDRLGTVSDAIFHAVFHAISAFCNAGFSLQSDSLIQLSGAWSVYASIMPLIVVGGLGFPVLHDLWDWVTARFKRRSPASGAPGVVIPQTQFVRQHRLSLHSKVVLTSSLVLIIVPAILLFAFESYDWRSERQRRQAEADPTYMSMVDLDSVARARAALFQSISARTAGFNTVAMDADSMSPASHFLLMVLMFVGGSPASTAGGVKTVAMALLVLAVVAELRRRRNVEVFGRSIADDVLRRAAVVVIVMFFMISLATMILASIETVSLREEMFEVVSAFGTVGYSTGLTPRLTAAGRVVIMFAMFAGRLGPLTLMIALAGHTTPARYAYPSERVMIA